MIYRTIPIFNDNKTFQSPTSTENVSWQNLHDTQQIDSSRQRLLDAMDDRSMLLARSRRTVTSFYGYRNPSAPYPPKSPVPTSPPGSLSSAHHVQPIGSPFFRAVLKNLKNSNCQSQKNVAEKLTINNTSSCSLRMKKSGRPKNEEDTTKKRRSWFLMFKNKK